jgi:inosine-uridine nucleoside N-ribohydrolase
MGATSRREFIGSLAAGALVGTRLAGSSPKIPVILDTDIGDDIDDTWALILALRSPELDLKLVVGDYGRPLQRAQLLGKLLESVGRADIPISLGIESPCAADFRQAKWIEGYDLAGYPGKVQRDGVQAIIDLIMNSPQPVALICIGPVPNIAAALLREPRIAKKARFVGMHGSVRLGYNGAPKPEAEWNVKCNPSACRAALSASWDITITPLDTCSLVRLKGNKFARVRDSANPMSKVLMENYRLWSDWNRAHGQKGPDPAVASSTLYDCAAVYLAISQELCVMEQVRLRVDDDGFTRPDAAARQLNVATRWKDLPAFEDFLVARLTERASAQPGP